ncbi:transcription factor FER-LIKE IRON DEFICIENCY-INDUCED TRANSCRIPTION FACTOR [Silene latifolia]|uniref:transcription factor FER-LIKE IRON DEFICIENCY-INDUCED TRANSCRIPTION FACTOR n=1 Tax=Silene latifolia TaxID=37657 RepID=UPI003D76FBCB
MNHPNSSGNITPTIPYFGNEFNIQDFVDPPLTFDQVIEMMGGEATNPITTRIGDINQNFDAHIFTATNVQGVQNYNQSFTGTGNAPGAGFDSFNSPTMSCTNNSLINSFSGIDNDMINGENEDDDDEEDNCGEGENSSANNSNGPSKKGKVDRSRTLISERRRRGRMKEKLYALRALVPNITKMDKASIVGDAVLYLQDLQMQAKKLKSQIEGLESSYESATRFQALVDTTKKNVPLHHIPVYKIIMQVDVVRIEDREFYVKVISNKGEGVAAALYRALDSLSSFIIKSSNLSSLSDEFVLTFTLNVGKCMEDFSLPNIRLWISGALLNQGFEFQTVHNA